MCMHTHYSIANYIQLGLNDIHLNPSYMRGLPEFYPLLVSVHLCPLQMEREVAEGLLVTRLAEMSRHWDQCRENLVMVMSQVQDALGHIADVCQQLCTQQDQLVCLDRQVEVLQEALHTPNHPLISMQDRWVVTKNSTAGMR